MISNIGNSHTNVSRLLASSRAASARPALTSPHYIFLTTGRRRPAEECRLMRQRDRDFNIASKLTADYKSAMAAVCLRFRPAAHQRAHDEGFWQDDCSMRTMKSCPAARINTAPGRRRRHEPASSSPLPLRSQAVGTSSKLLASAPRSGGDRGAYDSHFDVARNRRARRGSFSLAWRAFEPGEIGDGGYAIARVPLFDCRRWDSQQAAI